jgi:glycosyltransferase involved in cell wall biosynthesis
MANETIDRKPVDLSIVIIARNEAKNIARGIESVLKAVRHHPNAEILLVDSASDDATVEIARQYPISIMRLPADWFLSVGAGRLIGMQYTLGELVLHMDGDMELDLDWVDRSVAYMRQQVDAGAVGGYYRNIFIIDGQIIGEQDVHHEPGDRIQEVRYVGGAALYRRSAIEAMGGFQPYIRGEEGVYMSLGIRHAGYKVVQLPYLMSKHYCVPPQSMEYSRRRLSLNMWLGFGQVPRYYLGTRLFWTYLNERGSFMIYLLGVAMTLVTLLATIFSKKGAVFGGWMLIQVIFLSVFIIRKRSLRKILASLYAHTGIAVSAVRGFLIRPRSAAEYPLNAEVVQVAGQGGAGVLTLQDLP